MSGTGDPETTGDDTGAWSVLRQFDPKAGAIAGAASYAVAYSVTFVLAGLDPGVQEYRDDVTWSMVDVVGWLFYGGHLVPLEQVELNGGRATSPPRGILDSVYLAQPEYIPKGTLFGATSAIGVQHAAYAALPVVSLAAAGYLLVARAPTPGVPAGAARGSSVVVGYLPALVAGTYGFAATVVMGGSELLVMPDPAIAAISGAVVPLVLGGAGGAFAAYRKGAAA